MSYCKTLVALMLLLPALASAHNDKRLVGINGNVYPLTPDEASAIEFLYKSMPMSDRLMWNADYYIHNVRTTLQAREELPWVKSVPEHIWRHFVLPVRANNEYLDNFRTSYYEELRDRVKGLSMYDAALEVNHWLHEKVTYEPSDSRTSAPMSTIRTAKGRCGEESVLGVAAFRTVGIPARQVYTPRWAHTDDNHAWVEVWVDGKWHFLGACEPEPELNRAWFNAPVSRGMLMHTRVFGNYPGPEQIISVKEGITEINVTDNYVPVRESTVTVVDAKGKPVTGAHVEYKIYNYAEFYTAAVMTTDAKGRAMLRTGKGTMVAWATDGRMYGFAPVESESTRLVLSHKIGEAFETDIDVVPPAENPIPSQVTAEQERENLARFAAENRMRENYEKGFFGAPYCELTMDDLEKVFTPEQAARVGYYLSKARGNWQAIYDFLVAVPEKRLPDAFAILGVISDKDLRDTPAKVLINTINATRCDADNPYYAEYILNPRISNELLTDYRLTLRLPGHENTPMTVSEILDYIAANITINNYANAYRVPVTPTQVWKGREADAHSRDIFFVALCRNQGIPARIDAVTGATQYFDHGTWVTVNFEKKESEAHPEGIVKGSYSGPDYLSDPEYYRHFTISAMDSGSPRLLEFGDDMGETFTSILGKGTSLPAGYYLLTTGVRQANGSVKAHLSFFNVEAGKQADVALNLRHDPAAVEVIGAINPEELYLPAGAQAPASLLSTTGRGYFIIALLGDTDEPSNHAATELRALQNTLEAWGRPLVVIGRERKELSQLPALHYGSDPDGKILKMLREATGKGAADNGNSRLPIILIADSFGRVVFVSEGYDTSLAQKVMSVIPQL